MNLVAKLSGPHSPSAPFTIPAFPQASTHLLVQARLKQGKSSPQGSPALASSSSHVARKTAPPLYNLTRGSKKRALDVATCDEGMQLAMNNYVKGWRSAGDTSEYYWRSWLQLHYAHWDGWRRHALDPVPLDPLKIHVVGSLLKAGGYRSAHNYIGIAKIKHVERGYA